MKKFFKKIPKKKNILDEFGLAQLLGVTPDVNPSEGPETDPAQQKQRYARLIKASVSQHFPKPPSDLDKNLQQHLVSVQETVCNELKRLSPKLEKMGLIGCLIECYHYQILDHIIYLFKNVQSCKKSFELIKWILDLYLRVVVPPKKGDFLLLIDLVPKAKNLLLENVQKEVREHLDEILQTNRDDAIIQCINTMLEGAQEINPKLSPDVLEVCLLELKKFLGRYTSEQTEILRRKATMAIPEKTQFFKTLKTFKEIKEYVQTKCEGVEDSLIQEIVAMTENMEDVTSKVLMEIYADVAESLLHNYFKTDYNQGVLMTGLKLHFPKLLERSGDEQKRVMDEAYKLIAHIYLKHLVRSSQKKLRKCWGRDFAQKVIKDAELLHDIISDLAPDVKHWNLMLLKIPELLDCNDIDALKLIVASMQYEFPTWSEDEEFLSTLLKWKGLSKWKISEVLDALPGHEPTHRSIVHHIRSVYQKIRMG